MSEDSILDEFISLLPTTWAAIYANEVADQVSLNGRKIKERDYAKHGRYPIIDQGQQLVGGYTDDASKLIASPLPLLIFGDHTKVVKYLDTPFAPGAEGVKVLAPKAFIHPRAFFYFLQYLSAKIPDKGYARHFQHIAKEPFPVPPEGEQARIVEKLDELFSTLDKSAEYLRTAQDQLKAYRQSLLMHAFEGRLTERWREENHDKVLTSSDLGALLPCSCEESIPSSWVWSTIDSAANVSGGLTKNAKRDRLGRRVPYLRVANVYTNRLDLSEIKNIGVTDDEFERTRLQNGDLLVVEGNGSVDQIGRVAIWRNEIPNCTHQNHLIKVRVRSFIDPLFLLYYLSSPHGRKAITDVASSTSGLHTLSTSKVGRLRVPLTSLEEQQQIVLTLEHKLSALDFCGEQVRVSLQGVTTLRQSILKQAFSGKLVPQDTRDEPASALLKRTKAATTTFGTGSYAKSTKRTKKVKA